MAYNEPSPGTLKRKRRRRADKPSISAKLQLDNTLQGDLAVVSADLADDLCLSCEYDHEGPWVHRLNVSQPETMKKYSIWPSAPGYLALLPPTTSTHVGPSYHVAELPGMRPTILRSDFLWLRLMLLRFCARCARAQQTTKDVRIQ